MYLEIVMDAALCQKMAFKEFYMIEKLFLFYIVCLQVYLRLLFFAIIVFCCFFFLLDGFVPSF